MKKTFKQIPPFAFALLPALIIIICAWQDPNNQTQNINVNDNNADTAPKGYYNDKKINMHDFDEAMKELDVQMSKLDEQMKNLDINIDKQVKDAVSNINIDEIQKQTEQSLKAIDWDKMHKDVDESIEQAKNEIAKIDFDKIKNDVKEAQEKLNSEAFKEQLNSEKLHKTINEAMKKANEGMEKAKEELQRMKAFTNELAADGLIDKQKGYTIKWKDGDLYINGKKQPENISNKYRKYENKNGGEINMQPDEK